MITISSHDMGIQCLFQDYLVFFGHQQAVPDSLSKTFPHFENRNIKQTHSDTVVEATTELVEADAHYSKDPFLALQIKTADCLPVFAIDPVTKHIAGIHAGWRGVASQITSKAINQLLKMGSLPHNIQVLIGPHIRKQSFEVHEPVWVELMDSVPVDYHHQFKQFYESLPEQKYRVDLEGIVRTQIRDLKVPEKNIHSVEIDTFSDQQWHSFRRDREQSGRNISFVARFR